MPKAAAHSPDAPLIAIGSTHRPGIGRDFGGLAVGIGAHQPGIVSAGQNALLPRVDGQRKTGPVMHRNEGRRSLALAVDERDPTVPERGREQSLPEKRNAHYISVERPTGADAIEQRRLILLGGQAHAMQASNC